MIVVNINKFKSKHHKYKKLYIITIIIFLKKFRLILLTKKGVVLVWNSVFEPEV